MWGPIRDRWPVRCLRDRGVCLHCALTGRPVVVPDVERFPGHIACDARAKSEIALPVIKGDKVMAVFDVDSADVDQFDEEDVAPLIRILELLQPYL